MTNDTGKFAKIGSIAARTLNPEDYPVTFSVPVSEGPQRIRVIAIDTNCFAVKDDGSLRRMTAEEAERESREPWEGLRAEVAKSK